MKRLWPAPPHLVVMDAVPDDYGAIAKLHAAGFSRGWRAQEIAALDEQDTVHTLVVRREGAGHLPPDGFVMLRKLPHEAEILSIAVKPDMRGRGYGEALLRAAVGALRADRVPKLMLEVASTNETARALYKRFGFETVGLRKAYYKPAKRADGLHEDLQDGVAADALVMALDLL